MFRLVRFVALCLVVAAKSTREVIERFVPGDLLHINITAGNEPGLVTITVTNLFSGPVQVLAHAALPFLLVPDNGTSNNTLYVLRADLLSIRAQCHGNISTSSTSSTINGTRTRSGATGLCPKDAEARYMGMVVKYGADFQVPILKLAANASARVAIGLSRSYALAEGVEYSVALRHALRATTGKDLRGANATMVEGSTHCCFKKASTSTPETPAKPTGPDLDPYYYYNNSKQTSPNGLSFNPACTAEQRTLVSSAFANATGMVNYRLRADNAQCYNQQKELFFGKMDKCQSVIALQKLQTFFAGVKAKTLPLTINCVAGVTSGCLKDYVAYTFPDDLNHNIMLCDLFWTQAPVAWALNSMGGTLIHESMHNQFVDGTQDTNLGLLYGFQTAYGLQAALTLAATDSEGAVVNSDNYQFFTEATCRSYVYVGGIPSGTLEPKQEAELMSSPSGPPAENVCTDPESPRFGSGAGPSAHAPWLAFGLALVVAGTA